MVHPGPSFRDPEFDALTFEMGAGYENLQAAEAATAKLTGSWRVDVVPNGKGNRYDALLIGPQTLDEQGAWQAAHLLRAGPGVIDAQPLFSIVEVLPDAQPQPPAPPAPGSASEESFGGSSTSGGDEDFDWSVRFVGAEDAWDEIPPSGGARFGKGIRIGHPDSGYRYHAELGPRVLVDQGVDFVDGDDDAHDERKGGHGLATASVIMSADNRGTQKRSVTGIAPACELIPYRVTKRRWGLPAPILFRSGARRLRKAIWQAIEDDCHVISISLGWLGDRALHEAVRAAVDADLIVVAAAGNYTGRLVIWPGAYPEVICMAGCDADGKPWSGSARGSKVDFTGPAKGVWRATRGGGPPLDTHVAQGSGTSYAVATTAGIAGLWLAFHGRQALIDRYRPAGVSLQRVFRYVLDVGAHDPPKPGGKWGSGTVHAAGCLTTPLPAPAVFDDESLGPTTITTGDAITEAFPDVPSTQVRTRVAKMLKVEAETLGRLTPATTDEVLHRLVTRPEARAFIEGAQRMPGEESMGPGSSSGEAPSLGALSPALLTDLGRTTP